MRVSRRSDQLESLPPAMPSSKTSDAATTTSPPTHRPNTGYLRRSMSWRSPSEPRRAIVHHATRSPNPTEPAQPVSTPADWTLGQRIIVSPAMSTDDARQRFGDVDEVKPYLRWASPSPD